MVVDHAGRSHDLIYDQLAIATGAIPIRPLIQGLDLPGVYLIGVYKYHFKLDKDNK